MLSRVANSLFWMSRQFERAENTARIVDTSLQLLLDFRDLDDDAVAGHWTPILHSTGDDADFFKRYEKATGKTVTEFLVFDEENPNSIISSIAHARENARMVRDQITMELWEELNRLYLWSRSTEARNLWQHSPTDFFGHIKNGSLLLLGLVYATFVHDEGWQFMQLGKFLERADKVTRILDVRHKTFPETGRPKSVDQHEILEWSAVLKSCSAWDAFKDSYRGALRPEHAVELLLFHPEFPRSVRYCVEKFDACLHAISGVPSRRFGNKAEMLSGRLLAEMEYGTLDEVLSVGLHKYLDQLQGKFNAIGEAVFEAYIFQPFVNMEDEILIQQEMQQQQATVKKWRPQLDQTDYARR